MNADLPHDDYDQVVTGERKSVDAGEVETGVAIVGERTSTTMVPAADLIEVYVGGDRNSVVVRGSDEEVALSLVGSNNSVTVGTRMSVRTERDEGVANSLSRREFETDDGPDLVRRSEREAYASLGLFGVETITFQSEAEEQERCQFCGREARSIVHRHERKVLTVLGLNVTLEKGGVSDECEHCTRYVPDSDLEFTDEERYQIYD